MGGFLRYHSRDFEDFDFWPKFGRFRRAGGLKTLRIMIFWDFGGRKMGKNLNFQNLIDNCLDIYPKITHTNFWANLTILTEVI